MNTITSDDDTIQVEDIMERVECLEERECDDADPLDEDEKAELQTLSRLLSDMRGYGGEVQWRGDWYPHGLIRDSFFEDYARNLAEETDAIPSDLAWPCTCIDWDAAAEELKQDYSSVEFDGVTYWYRG